MSLLVQPDGPIVRVTLDRPAVRNAFNEELIARLTAWAESVTAGGPIRAAVLQGSGKIFCAGADLEWMAKMIGYSREDNLRDSRGLARMFQALDALPIPLVGRIQGAALGGGVGLAAVCDIVVAAEDAIFGFTEVKLGILPAVISPYALAKIGRSAARELFLTGARFSAARAREIGLVHTVVDAGDLDRAVAKVVNDLATSAPGAVAASKTLIAAVASAATPAAAIDYTVEAIAERRVTGEGQEGMRAFLEEAAAVVDRVTIRRVLIANRGEIALRVIRACREAGIETVAVYSDADARARHVRAADAAVRIGAAPASESYLKPDAIIDAARATGADAVHPGYGFLSENAGFADACVQAGLIFIGPPADAIERMGSKIGARALMERAGVPVVPGRTPRDQTDAGVMAAAREIGFPVLIKASAGGGGKGMREAHDDRALGEAVPAARREALAAFGDGTLYAERLIERPRHIEIQIFCDAHDGAVHLFERECSVQRRHQKIVEESPSIALTPALREAMGAAAIAAARGAGYRNAGTIEFLLEEHPAGARFYFLEMNTRLQVEHPVTESVTGVDLVRAQLAVASGDPLPWRQHDLTQRGHAIECRVYAEDPSAGFLPQAGPLRLYREPSGPGIRIDSGVEEGTDVTVHYDPMLAKLIASGETRDAAIARAITALRSFPVFGVRTNVEFLIRLLEHDAFRRGALHTAFVDEHLTALLDAPPAPDVIAEAARFLASTPSTSGTDAASSRAKDDPWTRLTGWGR